MKKALLYFRYSYMLNNNLRAIQKLIFDLYVTVLPSLYLYYNLKYTFLNKLSKQNFLGVLRLFNIVKYIVHLVYYTLYYITIILHNVHYIIVHYYVKRKHTQVCIHTLTNTNVIGHAFNK
jgi:hypothetical protein